MSPVCLQDCYHNSLLDFRLLPPYSSIKSRRSARHEGVILEEGRKRACEHAGNAVSEEKRSRCPDS